MEPVEITPQTSKKALVASFLLGALAGAAGYWGVLTLGIPGIFASRGGAPTEGEVASTLGEEIGDLLRSTRRSAPQPAPAQDASGAAEPIARGPNTLIVSDQPAGGRVLVSMLDLSENGWVAVHEMTEDGSFGNILGARRFPAGKSFGEDIALLRSTMEGQSYAVVLHADDGNGEFSYNTTERPLRDASGTFIAADFVALAEQSE